MNIIQFTEDYLPNPGGIAVHVYELTKALIKKGHKVVVITTVKKNNFIDNFFVIRISQPVLNLKLKKITNFQYLLLILNKIRSLGMPDIFHWHTYNGIAPVVAKFLPNKVKKVLTNHSSGFLNDLENNKFNYLKKVIKPADLIISPSKELKEKSKLFTNQKCIYIPNGVDPTVFLPLKNKIQKMVLRKKYNIPLDKIIVLSPRRAVKKNGIHVLLKAIQYIKEKNIIFLLVGAGIELNSLKDMAKESNILDKVLFLGGIQYQKMIDYYQISDFVVLPSLKEATSIAGLEAMSCGLPIVGTKVGGIPDLIDDGENGFLCKSNNSIDLSEKINLMIKKKNEWIKFGKHSREKVLNNFTWDRIAEKTINIYKKLIIKK